MGYETRWAIRVRATHADGVMTEVDPAVSLCVSNYSINNRGILTPLPTDCLAGQVYVGGGKDVQWSFDMPRLTPEWTEAMELMFAGGSTISYEVITNPFLADGITPRTTGLKIAVLFGTTIEDSDNNKQALQAGMLRISGRGGQWYSYKIGSRTGFPAPFDEA